ncbi:MAG: transcriptional regulator [Candidatus Hodarchaeales archaeon]|jgi:DNA-binding MarR family transcriptional regulator
MINGIKKADPLIFHPKRLMIMSLLIAIGPMTQGQLRKKCNLTWGSIPTHLERLEKAEYISQRDVITRKGPRVLVKVTSKGANNYKETLSNIQQFLKVIKVE